MDTLNNPSASTPAGRAEVRALPPPSQGTPVSRWPRPRWWQVVLLLVVAPVVGVLTFFMVWAGTFDISKLGEMPQRATVYDFDGNRYSTLRASENRVVVPIDKVSPLFLNALVAREDTRFYSHHGVTRAALAGPWCATLRAAERHRARAR